MTDDCVTIDVTVMSDPAVGVAVPRSPSLDVRTGIGPPGPPGGASVVAVNVGSGMAPQIVHNMGTRDVVVHVYRTTSPYDMVLVDVEHTDENTVTLRLGRAVSAGQYRCVVVAQEEPQSPVTGVDVRTFGAVGDGITDDQLAIQTALNEMPEDGVLLFPAGFTFNHSSYLLVGVDGLTLRGGGTIRATHQQNATLGVNNHDNVTIENLTIVNGVATSREASYEATGIVLIDTIGCIVRNVHLVNAAAASIHVAGSSEFVIENCVADDSWSDSFHMTAGSHHGTVQGCTSNRSGDDSYACVSYENDGQQVHHILVANCTSTYGEGGRGFSVVGGHDITYRNMTVDRSNAASVYIGCEGAPYFTYGVDNVLVDGVVITNANTNASIDHGAMLIYHGRDAADGIAVRNVTILDADVTDTRMAAARQVGIVVDDIAAMMERILVDGLDIVGGGTPLGGVVPDEAWTVKNWTVDGVPQTDIVGWT